MCDLFRDGLHGGGLTTDLCAYNLDSWFSDPVMWWVWFYVQGSSATLLLQCCNIMIMYTFWNYTRCLYGYLVGMYNPGWRKQPIVQPRGNQHTTTTYFKTHAEEKGGNITFRDASIHVLLPIADEP